MSLTVAIQMDPPARLNPAGDSTIVLALEAIRRGYQLYWYPANSLSLRNERLWSGAVRRISFHEQAESFFTQGEPETLVLNEVDAVLMRQDPPFDMSYLSATYLLERLQGATLVANDPFHVRNAPEKIFPLAFAEFMPPTLITRSETDIRDFLREYGDIVVKPVYGYGGHAVFRLQEGGDNVAAILESLLAGPEPLVAQQFRPEVSDKDCRVVMINGKYEGAVGRLPATGEVRANFRVGGSAAKVELTAKQREMCEAIGPELKARGIYFAGLDFIGDWLTEINITSPTGLRPIKQLYSTHPEHAFWDAIELAL
jgi:glutathione synthase